MDKIIDIMDLMRMNEAGNRFAAMYNFVEYDNMTEFEVRVGIDPLDEETDGMIQELIWEECRRNRLNPADVVYELLLRSKEKTYINVIDMSSGKEYPIPFALTNDERMSAVFAVLHAQLSALIRIYDLHMYRNGKKVLLSEFRENPTEDKQDD